MPSSDQLYFVAYLEPQPTTAAWYRDVLCQFWQHGLSYSSQWLKTLTWEEELEHQPDFFMVGDAYQPEHPQQTLTQWLDEAANAGSATLHC